jgi:hypothetical protein
MLILRNLKTASSPLPVTNQVLLLFFKLEIILIFKLRLNNY